MMIDDCATFFGKYRGSVENTLDPYGIGRLQVSVPDVFGEGTLAWAMPCLPGAGPGVGIYVLPPIGAKVWIDFERGDPEYPVWSGGYWDQGDAPVAIGPQNPLTRCWAGENFKVEFLDAPGLASAKISITTAAGEAVIEAGPDAMVVSFANGEISLGLDGVTVNKGNLKVLP